MFCKLVCARALKTSGEQNSHLPNKSGGETASRVVPHCNRSIEETDTKTIPSKRQQRVTSLAADNEELKIGETLSDQKVQLKRDYFVIIN